MKQQVEVEVGVEVGMGVKGWGAIRGWVMALAAISLLAGCSTKKGEAATGTAADGALLAKRAARVNAALADSGAAGEAAKDGEPIARWLLPKQLGEVSGLALTPDGRLFAQDDSHARVTEIDYRSGKIVKRFNLAPNPGPVDFEAIAVAGDAIYLLTSKGVIYETHEPPADGKTDADVSFKTMDTGLEKNCEFEGIAVDSARSSLLLACKVVKDKDLERSVVIYRWKLGSDPSKGTASRITLAPGSIPGLGNKVMNPSDITIDPKTGNYVLISGREKVLVEITPAGSVVSSRELKGNHPQPEGVAITKDGILIISDEAGGGPAAITLYRRP